MSHRARHAQRPATYRDIFAGGEYRAVFMASALSWTGDYLAKAAVTALIYHETRSVIASAAAFAISFLPWVVGGPVLAAVAERYPPRTIMITCDLARAVLIGLIAIPGMPIPLSLALLFLTALLNPPFDAARSSLLPRVLEGDRYVLAVATQNTASQTAEILGYLFGSALAAYHARLALLLDSGTFLLSAFLIGLWIHQRPSLLNRDQRTHLLKETAEGFRVVFGIPVLRSIAIVALIIPLLVAPAQGLSPAWAGEISHSRQGVAFNQALLMMSLPIGLVIGSILLNRLVPPDHRRVLIRPLAVLAAVSIIPLVLHPPVILTAVLYAVDGFCVAGVIPASNGLFVRVLPRQYRARAFGVMQGGVQAGQGLSVLVAGWLASHLLPVWTVLGLVGITCTVLLIGAIALWPKPEVIDAAIAENEAANAAAESGEPPRPPGTPGNHSAGAHAAEGYRRRNPPAQFGGSDEDTVPSAATGAHSMLSNGGPTNGNHPELNSVPVSTPLQRPTNSLS